MRRKLFAASGSCSAEEKIIEGRVVNQITFVSNEFMGTMDGQGFWDDLAKLAREKGKYIRLVY